MKYLSKELVVGGINYTINFPVEVKAHQVNDEIGIGAWHRFESQVEHSCAEKLRDDAVDVLKAEIYKVMQEHSYFYDNYETRIWSRGSNAAPFMNHELAIDIHLGLILKRKGSN
ncbi:MAG: hypothetical protein DI539_01725 [Flavobacterium psychrophilum]|nr:MAG: hypothetical protein DI539_01725 [Flavobacterium psychrophilum]